MYTCVLGVFILLFVAIILIKQLDCSGKKMSCYSINSRWKWSIQYEYTY